MEAEWPSDKGSEEAGESGDAAGKAEWGHIGELYQAWHEAYRDLEQLPASQGREAVQQLRDLIRESEQGR
jgi:hypothetical protein